jgi:hypothetical protein
MLANFHHRQKDLLSPCYVLDIVASHGTCSLALKKLRAHRGKADIKHIMSEY